MQIVEYFCKSAYGEYYIPCEVIGENEDGRLIIQYRDPCTAELLEKEVDNDALRASTLKLNKRYISKIAIQAAQQFRDDLFIVDEQRLNDIANVIFRALIHHLDID